MINKLRICFVALLAAILVIPALAAAGTNSAANTTSYLIVIDNKSVPFKKAPVVKNMQLLAPVKELFEAAGAKVTEKKPKKIFEVVKGTQKGTYTIGSRTLKTSTDTVEMLEPAQLIDGTAYVPVESFLEVIDSINCATNEHNDRYDYIFLTKLPGQRIEYKTDLKGNVLTAAQVKKLKYTDLITYSHSTEKYTIENYSPFYTLWIDQYTEEKGVKKLYTATFIGRLDLNGFVNGTLKYQVYNYKKGKYELEWGYVNLMLPYKNGKVDLDLNKVKQMYESKSGSISLDNQLISFKAKPVIIGDSLMVPVVEGLTKLGYTVEEVEKDKKFKVSHGESSNYIEVGRNQPFNSDGEPIDLYRASPLPAVQAINGTIMFPFDLFNYMNYGLETFGGFPYYNLYNKTDEHSEIYRDLAGNAVSNYSYGQLDIEVYNHWHVQYAVKNRLVQYYDTLSIDRNIDGEPVKEKIQLTGNIKNGYFLGSIIYSQQDKNFRTSRYYYLLPVKIAEKDLDTLTIAKLKQMTGIL